MSGEAFGYDEDSDEVIPEEWPTFYTPVPVWVLLCGCSAQGYRMYAFLAEHINNRTPGKRIAFPSQKAIARALKLKDYRDVAKYREELAAVGAIRFEEFRYAGGMRRRYRYWVRFNPPEGYEGLTSLAGFYEANPDVKGRRKQSVTAPVEPEDAGRSGGGKKPTSGGGGKPTSHGGKSPTAQQPDPQQPDPLEPQDAPSGRSPVDGRSPSSAGSSARGDEGGSAASGTTRNSSSTKKPAASGKRHSRAELAVVKQVLAFLPPELPADKVRLPVVADAILSAMAADGRNVEEMGQRIVYRWLHHGFAEKAAAGQLESPVGAVVALVRPLRRGDKHACADSRCENGRSLDTGEECRLCAVRNADRKAEQQRNRPPRAEKPPMPPQRAHAAPAKPLLEDCVGPLCTRSVPAGRALCGDCADAAASEGAQDEHVAFEEFTAAQEDARLRAEFAAQNPGLAAYSTVAPF
ncbi:hypothetical protein [Streptomyces sp. NPDC050600]|uniref:hypothetical protein n=1 Tax=Streptomyces sp. NPDC050600 TaxID=3157213 RepID=UPI003449D4A4